MRSWRLCYLAGLEYEEVWKHAKFLKNAPSMSHGVDSVAFALPRPHRLYNVSLSQRSCAQGVLCVDVFLIEEDHAAEYWLSPVSQ